MLASVCRFADHLLGEPLPTQVQYLLVFVLTSLLFAFELHWKRDRHSGQNLLFSPDSLHYKILLKLFCSELSESSFVYFVVGCLFCIFLYFLLIFFNLFPQIVPIPFQFLVLLDEFVLFLVVVAHAVEYGLVCIVFNAALIQLRSDLVQSLLQTQASLDHLLLELLFF